MVAPRAHGVAPLAAALVALLALVPACQREDPPQARTAGEGSPPERIVSLVPSVTSMIVALGEGHRLVGRTDFDRAPPLDTLPSVGGGLNPSLERLVSLRPDLVLRFEGDSDTDTPERLDELGIAHLAVRTDRIEDVRRIVRLLGRVLDRSARADSLVAQLDRELDEVRRAASGRAVVRTVFVLGGSPPWVAGPGTFVDELIELAGGVNVFFDLARDYGGVSPEAFRARGPEVILTGPTTALTPALTGDARVERLPASVELPGLDLGEAARAVARALHPELRSGLRP
jgi:iron complex transport system substrate-binding protein